jgi:hypothetical protein
MWFAKDRGSSEGAAPSQINADGCRPSVPLTWIQTPTLAEANGMAPLAGTSFYQEAVRRVVQHLEATRPTTEMFTVQLALLPSGPYAGSVAVYADGRRVASIPSSWSGDYRLVVEELAAEGKPATCRAVLAGYETGRETIGIWALLRSTRAARFGGAPMLPQLIGTRVQVTESMLATLDGSIKSRAKKVTDRRVGRLDVATGQVAVDDQPIGSLVDPLPETIAAARAAAKAGLETTCGIRFVREPEKPLRVVADLPH